MTTARDLTFTAMDVSPSRPVEQGDLSLALAGAELIDLLTGEAVTLEDDLIVPGMRVATADRLLGQADEALVRERPHESVEDWLWRRGRGLASAYVAAFEKEGQLARQRHRWLPFREGRTELADSPDRHAAAQRWASREPVLVALAAAVGIGEKTTGDTSGVENADVETVLATVDDALLELEAVRQRRAIEKAAFDNVWRGE
ncbi:GOLPH3/VPS74 family protein [Streptomyces olivochromogenes]|uniref:GOLPH3/VPS74 family protein n=1 Tax=Streptomyces olivochromogenes TaxID=1963 RepID=UPI001F1FB163|nr:GPP34 family phosphoprotein [Streptomyces olivochromogenes]MCF3129291.1 GPP34 family phosphoprotein [Streptomyces olivochromogenes]